MDGVSTKDIGAYDLYLQALSENATFSYGGLQKSEGLLKEALAMDPSFLDAKVELASNYRSQINTGLRERDSTDTDIIAMMEQVYALFQQYGFTFADSPGANIRVLALSGKTDEAIDVALTEYFTKSYLWFGDWKSFFAQPYLADVVANPRVQEELQRWESEEAAYSEQLQAYLASL